LDNRPKRLKTSFRKKRSTAPTTFTDAEIEQQFGERLPVVKNEHDDFIEPIRRQPETPIERARAKLVNALGRKKLEINENRSDSNEFFAGGHEPDAYLLKIRSKEQKIVEVQLAIYSTADWHSERTKILMKIEEVLKRENEKKLKSNFCLYKGSTWSSS